MKNKKIAFIVFTIVAIVAIISCNFTVGSHGKYKSNKTFNETFYHRSDK